MKPVMKFGARPGIGVVAAVVAAVAMVCCCAARGADDVKEGFCNYLFDIMCVVKQGRNVEMSITVGLSPISMSRRPKRFT